MSEQTIPLFKHCPKCDKDFPITKFWKNSQHKDGFDSWCRYCRSVARGHNPIQHDKPPEGMKYCPGCESVYPATTEYFGNQKSNTNGLKAYCRSCDIKKDKEKRGRNPQYYAAASKKHRDSNKEKVYQRNRSYEQRNRHKVNARSRRKYAANPKSFKVNSHRYEARKRNLPDTLSTAEWERCLEYFEYSCTYCGRPRGLWHTLAADHWIPLSNPACPGTVSTNILPACHGLGGCNNSKNNADPVSWLTAKLGARKAKQKLAEIAVYFKRITEQEKPIDG